VPGWKNHNSPDKPDENDKVYSKDSPTDIREFSELLTDFLKEHGWHVSSLDMSVNNNLSTVTSAYIGSPFILEGVQNFSLIAEFRAPIPKRVVK
jgi:hypothetical protein